MAGSDLGRAGEIGGDPQPRGDLPSGALLGKYRIVDVIGRGGMGVVYRAEHVDLGTLRALKTLAGELAHHPQARSRFLKEAKAAAGINHPHVVKVFDCGEHEGIPFFVMEHLEGEDLESAVDRTTLTVDQIVGIMLAVCAAIAEMHAEGLLHRDLKPGNVFLARNKLGDIVPTVLDFGIARPIVRGPSATRTQDGAIVGTAHYTSPEQLADLPAGECTDQYALGVTLYRCATGVLPFPGETALAVYGAISVFQFPRPRDLNAQLPVEFEDVILRAMNERPADRFASVYDLGKALLRFASKKHQALWTEYYSRVRSPKGAVSMAIPVVGSAGWLAPEAPDPLDQAGHRSNRRAVPPVGGTEPLLPAASPRSRLNVSREAKPSADEPPPRTRAPRHGVRALQVIVIVGAVALAAAGIFLWRGATASHSLPSSREAVRPALESRPAPPAAPPAIAPPSTPEGRTDQTDDRNSHEATNADGEKQRAQPDRARGKKDRKAGTARYLPSSRVGAKAEKEPSRGSRSEPDYPRMGD